jgi:hypothetical protein
MADTRRARSVAAASEVRGAREEEGGRVVAGRAACVARACARGELRGPIRPAGRIRGGGLLRRNSVFFQFPNFKSNEIQTSNYILNKKKTFSGIDPKIKVAQK